MLAPLTHSLRPHPQVYAHYRPVAKKPSTGVARTGSERTLTIDSGDSGKEREAVPVRERLSITCRLVKDFQQEIQLFARLAEDRTTAIFFVLVPVSGPIMIAVVCRPLQPRLCVGGSRVRTLSLPYRGTMGFY